MAAEWLSNSSEVSGRVSAGLSTALATLSQPDNARRLRQLVLLVLAIWAVTALARLVWALVPDPTPGAVPRPSEVINPVSTASGGQAGGGEEIDIARMMDWHLFGEAGAEPVAPVAQPEVIAQDNAREGIEKGARQTRLKLVLRGIVASTEDGLGHAIIEYQSRQDVYAVEDKLPVPGRVTLAKVMPQQVVINNGGTYELLKLFDKSALSAQAPAPTRRPAPQVAKAEDFDKRSDLDATRLAAGYRKRLYQNPQSLAKVVGVSAVREAGQLVGYRVSPGEDREQFEQLGFQSGDLVKSVNGVDLSSPANTMRLYNLMRTAGEAVFEVQRKGQPVTLSVSLDEAGAQ